MSEAPYRNPGLRLPVVQSPTRVELEQRCRRRHVLSNLLHLRSYKSPSLAFGTLIHRGTDAWMHNLHVEGLSAAASYEAMMDAALTDYPRWLGEGKDYHSEALAKQLLNKYAKESKLAAGSVYDDWEVLDMERRFTVELPGGSLLTFKLDRVLASLKRGELLVVDTKTSSRPNERWARGMRRSIQQRTYNALAETCYQMPVTEHYIEGIDKKGQVAGQGGIVYEQIDLMWTPGYVQEAVGLAMRSGDNDRWALIQAYGDAGFLDGEGILAEDDDELLHQALLEHAATKEQFNEQDCYSYFVECPFRGVCDADPSERVALLNDPSNFERDEEPWQLEAAGQVVRL